MTVYRLCAAFAVLALLAGCGTKPLAPASQSQRSSQGGQQEASPQYRAQLHTELASGYYERGQMDIALQELEHALTLDPENAQAYNIYGLVYATMGDTRKAEQSFEHALQLAPNDSDIRHNWGWYLCQHNRERESLAQFEAAASNPLYRAPEVALVNAGRCAQGLGDAALAEQYFRRALAAQPGNAMANYGLALLAFRGGRYEEARNWMRRVMLTNNPPPEGLYLGMCVERKLGDKQAELSYVSQLRNRYPDSAEVKALGPGACE